MEIVLPATQTQASLDALLLVREAVSTSPVLQRSFTIFSAYLNCKCTLCTVIELYVGGNASLHAELFGGFGLPIRL